MMLRYIQYVLYRERPTVCSKERDEQCAVQIETSIVLYKERLALRCTERETNSALYRERD